MIIYRTELIIVNNGNLFNVVNGIHKVLNTVQNQPVV